MRATVDTDEVEAEAESAPVGIRGKSDALAIEIADLRREIETARRNPVEYERRRENLPLTSSQTLEEMETLLAKLLKFQANGEVDESVIFKGLTKTSAEKIAEKRQIILRVIADTEERGSTGKHLQQESQCDYGYLMFYLAHEWFEKRNKRWHLTEIGQTVANETKEATQTTKTTKDE
jgi:hypothetical protein